MLRLSLSALAVALAGCSTPGQLREDGVRSQHSLRQPPPQAARCLARNAEEYLAWFEAQARETDGGAYEVVVRSGGNPIAAANVLPNGLGSTATIWRASGMVFQASLPEAMAKGC